MLDEQLKTTYNDMIERRVSEIKRLTIEVQEIQALRDAVDDEQ